MVKRSSPELDRVFHALQQSHHWAVWAGWMDRASADSWIAGGHDRTTPTGLDKLPRAFGGLPKLKRPTGADHLPLHVWPRLGSGVQELLVLGRQPDPESGARMRRRANDFDPIWRAGRGFCGLDANLRANRLLLVWW